jgi:3',5'-cyclic AMP phosphodiesterase CpdA
MHTKDNRQANDLLKKIKQRYSEHKLIVTGDITDDGHSMQYQNAFDALKPFTGNVFIAPGNHDFGAAGNFYSKERALRFDEMLSTPLLQGGTFTGDNTPVINVVKEGDDQVVLIALDTNLETCTPFDFACGEIGDEQLSTLDIILSDPSIAGAVKLLLFHHHPFVRDNPFMELTDARKLMRTIYGRVDVLMFGHKHVYQQWQNRNCIPFILASDNSPGKNWVHEISIKGNKVTVKDVSVKINTRKKTGNKRNP